MQPGLPELAPFNSAQKIIARTDLDLGAGAVAIALAGALALGAQFFPAPLFANVPLATPNDVKLTLTTDQMNYNENSPIRLQIQLKNVSGHGILIDVYPAWIETYLIVRTSGGAEVRHGAPAVVTLSANHRYLLGSGKSIKLSWGRAWTDMRNWGYDNLAPGQYTIEALPNSGPPKDVMHAASNSVSITVHGT
jgi:hypothetical protein